MSWEIKQVASTKIKNPILIEGLPGMGNVGKIAVDFLIDSFNAKKIFELTSYDLPHCVIVNEENLVELPSIDIYYKNTKDRTLLFLAGDIQPLTEGSCYEFCHKVLDTFNKNEGIEIITLGGIALPRIPKKPRVYLTGNSKKFISKFQHPAIQKNIHGMVGPIIGVSGLLPGLAGKRNIPAIALLAETFGHPNYLGIRGAREILSVLKKHYGLNVNLTELDNEADDLERQILSRTESLSQLDRSKFLTKRKFPLPQKPTDYIG